MVISYKKLSEIAELNWGNTNITKASYIENGFPAFSASGNDGNLNLYEFETNGIVLSAIGAKCGKCFLANGKWTAIKNTITIIPNNDNNLRFLFYFLNRNGVWPQKGGGQPFISLGNAKEVNVPNFDLLMQTRIAEILDKADALRQKRKKSIKLLDDFLRSTFLEMFGDPIKNPKDWEKKKLKTLCSIRRGASPRPIKNFLGGKIPWIKIGDGTKGNNLYIEKTKEHIIETGAEKSVLLKKGTLIFANCGVSLGFARIIKIDGCIHDGWLALEKIDVHLNNIYLLKLINSITKYFQAIAPDGTQPNLNIGIMKEFEIPVPPIDLQNKYADIVHQVEKLKAKYKESEKELNNLFGSLMQRAFKGELT